MWFCGPCWATFDGAHDGADPAGGDQVQVVQQAVNQAGPEGVAATGRVLDVVRCDRFDVFFALIASSVIEPSAPRVTINASTWIAISFLVQPGFFLDQLEFVVIEDEYLASMMNCPQFVAIEQGHGLARIKNMRNTRR